MNNNIPLKIPMNVPEIQTNLGGGKIIQHMVVGCYEFMEINYER